MATRPEEAHYAAFTKARRAWHLRTGGVKDEYGHIIHERTEVYHVSETPGEGPTVLQDVCVERFSSREQAEDFVLRKCLTEALLAYHDYIYNAKPRL